MMYHATRKQEIAQAGGIRRVEFRYSGDIDESGRFHLKRCVGKSFFDKVEQAGAAKNAGVGSDSRISHVRPDKTA
jgi:hypothetical protein